MREGEAEARATLLRQPAINALQALLQLGEPGGPQRVDQTTKRLQALAPPVSPPEQWRRMAAERAVELYAQASLRVSTGVSVAKLPRDSRWTLDISAEEIESALEGFARPTSPGEIYDLLTATFTRRLRFFPLGRRIWEEFYVWFHQQSDQWLQVAEATNVSVGQDQSWESGLQMPLVLPWEEYEARPLGRLVRSLVRCALGDHASMITVIEYRRETPYILYERVEKGEFSSVQLFKGYTEEEVRRCLKAQGRPVVYAKRANIGALIAVWRQHRRYCQHGQRCRFLVSVLARLARHVQFDPGPPSLAGLTRVLKDIRTENPRPQGGSGGGSLVGALGKLDIEGQVPGLELSVGADQLNVNTGAPYVIRIADSVVLQLVEALARSQGLASASDQIGEIIATAAARGHFAGLPCGPLRSIARLSARRSATRLPPMLAAAKWSLRLIGSPLRVALLLGDRIFVLHFIDGNLGRVQILPAGQAAGPQTQASPAGQVLTDQEQWLALCRDDRIGFVHFLVNLQPALAEPRSLARVGRANRLRARQDAMARRLRFGERARGLGIYPPHDIAEALLRQFKDLGVLKILDFLEGLPL
jgi:hypothetical protein